MIRKKLLINDKYLPYVNDTRRVQIFFGGSSSGKSYFLSQRAVMDVIKGRNYLVVRNVADTVRKSVYNEIIKAIITMGLEHKFIIRKGDLTITCKDNNKQFLFAGLDNVEKLKSVTPIDGVITDIWIEEATEIDYNSYKQLRKRLRGLSNVPKRITFSFNPIFQTHWIYKEFFGLWDDAEEIYSDDNLLIIHSTYKDNHFLTQDDIEELENESDRYFYEVYTLGKWGVLGDVIFRNWTVRDLSNIRSSFDNIYNGMDFGFSNDPNAYIRVHVNNAKKEIYVFDEFYQSKMLLDETISAVKAKVPQSEFITCDSAGDLIIAEMNRNGINATPAIKGPNSVNAGIFWLQGYKIIIDKTCQHFKNEIQTYHWLEDKHGNRLNKPVDKDNHLMDALRYATEPLQHGSSASSARRL